MPITFPTSFRKFGLIACVAAASLTLGGCYEAGYRGRGYASVPTVYQSYPTYQAYPAYQSYPSYQPRRAYSYRGGASYRGIGGYGPRPSRGGYVRPARPMGY